MEALKEKNNSKNNKQQEKHSKVYKGAIFRIYPNGNQKSKIKLNFAQNRFIWNQMLNMQNERFSNMKERNDETKHAFVSNFNMIRLLKPLKGEYQWLKDAESTSFQNTCLQLEDSFKRFFKGLSQHPKFKSRANYAQSYTSTCISNNIRLSDDNSHIKLPKLGWMRCSSSAVVNGKIKSATIRRSSSGRFFAVLGLEFEPNKLELSDTEKTIGIAAGLDYLITLSNGNKYMTIDYEKAYRKKLLRWERSLSRRRILAKQRSERIAHELKRQGSTKAAPNWWDYPNYKLMKLRVAKLKGKIADIRNYRIQEITTEIVRNYDVIKFEELNVKAMLQNSYVARQIANQAWGKLKAMLKYKCEWYGKRFELVSAIGVSSTCSNCGKTQKKSDIRYKKVWHCPNCNIEMDKSVNSAKNVLKRMPIPDKDEK